MYRTNAIIIVLSRLLAKRYELANLERAVLDANRSGHELAEVIDMTLRELETSTASVARHVRLVLSTLVVMVFGGVYTLLATRIESTWATIQGRVWLGTLLVGLIVSIMGVNIRRVSDHLVGAACNAINVCKMTYRILRAVCRRSPKR